MSRKEKRKHVKEHKHITHSDAKCIFCGSTDVTVHHVVFRRFAPELENPKQSSSDVCSLSENLSPNYRYLIKLLEN